MVAIIRLQEDDVDKTIAITKRMLEKDTTKEMHSIGIGWVVELVFPVMFARPYLDFYSAHCPFRRERVESRNDASAFKNGIPKMLYARRS